MGVLVRNKGFESAPTESPVVIPESPAPRAAEQRPQGSQARPYVGPSLLSAALSIIGRLESTGDIQIDGKIEGEVKGQAIRIGAGAVVKGSVTGEIVELAGTIEGKVEAKSVILSKSARMTGDIVYQSLQIDQGAYFDGNSRPSQAKTVAEALKAAE